MRAFHKFKKFVKSTHPLAQNPRAPLRAPIHAISAVLNIFKTKHTFSTNMLDFVDFLPIRFSSDFAT